MTPLIAFLLAFAAAAAAGPTLIARLKALALAQTAYEDAPKSHQSKTGTPTMGGVLFLIAPVVALFVAPSFAAGSVAMVMIGCGLVGLMDDLAAIKRQRNRGLSARTKFVATIAVTLAFLALAAYGGVLPLQGFALPNIAAPAWLIIVLAIFAVLGTTHGVNLTDGLDGLAAGSVLPPFFFLTWFSLRAGETSLAIFDLAVIGVVLGFLLYNRHPAKVFMGDTGALALGGALAGSAVLSGTIVILPVIGAVFVAEALSVILQVTSFKTTGKRIFRMSPLHHHFELGGMKETQVTQGFWLASSVCSIVVIALCLR